jgi:HEAT repeat protein
MVGRWSSVLVARAARVVVEVEAVELAPDLVAAFVRFLDAPAKADEGCLAKVALAEAMDAVRFDESAPFLRGISYTQMEWTFEGRITKVIPGEGMRAEWTSSEKGHMTQVDTAPPLRARCAFALARLGGAEATLAITALLTDPESEARVGAAKAVAHCGGFDAELLLRLKANSEDDEVDVTAECLTGLMTLDPERSTEFVASFLHSVDEDLAQAAALALGEPGASTAFGALQDYRSQTILSPVMEDAVLLAVALTRRDKAVDYLLNVIAQDTPQNAARAVVAMRIYARGASVAERVREAVGKRDTEPVWKAFREHF